MAKKSHIYMYNIYLIYKNIKLATEVTNLDDLSVQLDTQQRDVESKNVDFQRIGVLFGKSDFLITKPDFF
jgi:hypothetical protein